MEKEGGDGTECHTMRTLEVLGPHHNQEAVQREGEMGGTQGSGQGSRGSKTKRKGMDVARKAVGG